MNFIGFLLPNRPEVENKWWNRLAKVLILGSTIIVTIIALALTNYSGWKSYTYTSYSFDPSYAKADGEEIPCNFYTYEDLNPTIDCGDIITSNDFLTRYTEARGTYSQLLEDEKTYTDTQIMNTEINNGSFNDIKVKRTTNIQYAKILGDLLLVILIAFAWIIFWGAILYRVLLYIIYGKK